MKGLNVLVLSEESMKECVQRYVNEVLVDEEEHKVTKVGALNGTKEFSITLEALPKRGKVRRWFNIKARKVRELTNDTRVIPVSLR